MTTRLKLSKRSIEPLVDATAYRSIMGSLRYLVNTRDFTLMSRGPAKRELVEDKVVWITGASRGIGEVLAKQFAALGAKLILSARNVAELGRVRSSSISLCPPLVPSPRFTVGKHAPAGVEILPLDLVSGERYLKAAVDKAEAFFSGAGVDYMIHNAAYEHPKRRSSFLATLNTDVLGTAILTKLLVPHMLRRGKGHFVVVGEESPRFVLSVHLLILQE
ncbi:unnamed protein product [Spirodela intermedia]|uniref:Uncharacterized protein n=1 Tax=Spirodela intermedia TaxID=51605 RepID=A0A7I8IRX4_SPIIN|nr:unnamed protein product [Spirodela intermedia]CAA6660306.1 unnamed protein product [Spirodela intermedia]